MSTKKNYALLIDADNSPASKIDVVLSEIAKYGVVNIRRAYGNWKSSNMKGWEKLLHENAIQPIQQFDYTKGKNSTDIAMVIDAMDLLLSKKMDGFCIMSSDSDFTPLVMRVRAEGKEVLGFGEKKTPDPFVNACSTFLYLEQIGSDEGKSDSKPSSEKSIQEQKKTTSELKADTKLVMLLRSAVENAEEDDGWSALVKVGSYIANQTSFDPRNYGYKKLVHLVNAIDLFDIEMRGDDFPQPYVRNKRKNRVSV